ncbi:hypothetical protein [Ruania alba]|uniref:Uncharacterized protein n=1 Tax=Ruania alba TaxID=648782 RepID=A0A1H5H362_9MICO|nr:hypothetical protein [Ruania alba]SEE22412.1 hypothetical protein SAMN04488554_1841 [Ruania alba]
MSSIGIFGDDVWAIVIPPEPGPDWAATTAQQVREAHEWSEDVPVQQILEAVRDEPGAGSWLVLVEPENHRFTTMRVLLLDEPIREDRQRELLDPPAFLPPTRQRVTIEGLGRGTRAAVVTSTEGTGVQTSIRWVFARPDRAVVALVGPTEPEIATAVLPVAEAVLAAASVDTDGVPFAGDEDVSIVLEDPPVEAWDL